MWNAEEFGKMQVLMQTKNEFMYYFAYVNI